MLECGSSSLELTLQFTSCSNQALRQLYSNQYIQIFKKRFSAAGLWSSTNMMIGSVPSDLQESEMLSELSKETASGKTPGSPCYQSFKSLIMTQMSHYIHKTGCVWVLFLSLAEDGIWDARPGRNGLVQVRWVLAGSLPWMNPTMVGSVVPCSTQCKKMLLQSCSCRKHGAV